ncbi:MAG TPA: hypothetical protein VJB57_15435 [Dehalococcoidia bacterium]|nr:hypothetical protein [Dehalococcoidia bacterium]
MTRNKLKIGVASAVAGVSLLAGGLVIGVPWASAQTPPQPTPQQQGTPQAPGTPRNEGTPRQGGQPGQQGDHDCPKDGDGMGRQGAGSQGSGMPGGTSFRGGPRMLRQ